jgi:holo-[acyl-carrier protein] synthase
MNEIILGQGLDLVECRRIEESISRFGDRFLERLFHPSERAYGQSQKFSTRHFAARFAAKEAISKAFGTGIGPELGWLDLEILRKESGEPYVCLHGKALDLLQKKKGHRILLSLTHTDQHALATAILIGQS